MTGMDVVIELRRDRVKPKSVFVDLVEEARLDPQAMGNSGIVTVNIARSDALGQIDFRPLVGLMVFVSDHINDPARHRKAATLIAAGDPAQLVMFVWEGDAFTVHRRWAGTPARTETFRA